MARSSTVLVNTSNLHVGGGVQVAVSFLDELSRLADSSIEVSVLASSRVDANLKLLASDISKFKNYRVYNTHGLSALWSIIPWTAARHQVVFTIFGPLYCPTFGARSLVGFAQPWIIYRRNEVYCKLSFFHKIRVLVRLFFQSIFFKGADRLVVEAEHVRAALAVQSGFDGGRISVVHNCVNSVYFHRDMWLPLRVNLSRSNFSLAFVGRDYPHKNTDILPYVKESLKVSHGVTVDMYVTLTADEWNRKSDFFRANTINVGEVDVGQCPTLYNFVDAVIFPSLLECFSATPLEAMVMLKPLFASDRPFVRAICGEHASYFNPVDPASAAAQIAYYMSGRRGQDDDSLLKARKYVLDFSDARTRAASYLALIQSMSMEDDGA